MARQRAGGGASGSPDLGKTIQRLRKAYNMSLGDLSEQSGVAKSIISQIERNETNPTIGTVWRLTRALDTTVDEVLKSDDKGTVNFLEHQKAAGIPVLTSQDGLCTLHIIGALNLVDFIQWYDFEAKPGGVLESEPHAPGTVEHLSLLEGELIVEIEGEARIAAAGETLRYRGDRPHKITNHGKTDAHATMVMVQRVTVVD
jgi:transcriptional regulator with XRE-family HTH domain